MSLRAVAGAPGVRRRLLGSALVAACGVLAGCGGGEVPASLAAGAAPTTVETTTSSSTVLPASTTTTVPAGPVTFAFAGDVHFEGVLRGQLDEDPAGLLAPIAPVLGSADISVVNLETAITQRGTAATKDYTFRAPETAYTALASAGVDVANVANNHGMDFGAEGLTDTLYSAAINGFPLIGIGNDATEAFRPFEATINGQQIAVFGATQVLDGNLIDSWSAGDGDAGLANALDPDRLVAAITEARPRIDTVVVYLHWGKEGETCPTERQTELADQLVAAGADIVVGSHAHRLQGAGRDGAAFVAYGLGNFAFYSPDGSPAAATGVLQVTATGRTVDGYEWVPATIRSGVPTPLEGAEAEQAQADWQALRDCTDLEP